MKHSITRNMFFVKSSTELIVLYSLKNRQAEAAEDDLVRTSFHNAELQMLLTDEKL